MVRLEFRDSLRTADDLTKLRDVLDLAECHSLRKQIADGCTLDGAGHDGTVERIRDKLVEQLVLAAAADDVQLIDALALDFLEALQRPAVLEREGLIDAARDLTDSLRHGLICIAAVTLNFLDHLTAGEELAEVGINDGAERLRLFGFHNDLVPAVGVSGLDPIAAALLNEPEAHDVAQGTEAALNGALIGEVGAAYIVAEDRLDRLHAEERPGTGGAEREAAGAGDSGDGGGRVMRADGGKACLIYTKLLGKLRAQMAAERTGAVDLGKNMLRKAELTDGLPVPVLRGGIVEHRGRDLGILGLLFAGQEIAKKIRQEQHRLRIFQRHVALAFTAVELIDGVEVLVGDAGARKERREIDDLPGLLKILVHCAAIGARIAKQMAVAVEQAVVHAPGVDADAVEITDIFLLEGKQAKLELIVEIRQIPIEYAVHLDVVIFEAVQLAHFEPVAVELAEDRAAIAGAKVKGKQILHRINLSFPQGSCGIFRFPSWR